MGKFQDLKVWQKAVDLAVVVYKVCQKELLSSDFGMKDQMQRASVSISSNIAEGDYLDTQKQAIKFLYYSKGSSAELLTQATICKKVKLLDGTDADHIISESQQISKMINKLIAYRSNIPPKT